MFCKQKVCFFTEGNSTEKATHALMYIQSSLKRINTQHSSLDGSSSAGSRRRAAARHSTRLRANLRAAGPPGPVPPTRGSRLDAAALRPARPGPASGRGSEPPEGAVAAASRDGIGSPYASVHPSVPPAGTHRAAVGLLRPRLRPPPGSGRTVQQLLQAGGAG